MLGIVSLALLSKKRWSLINATDFPHEHARSRVYRWGEDAIAGVCDTHGLLNVGFSFWNGKDRFLKERLFGLSNPQGNHGEVRRYESLLALIRLIPSSLIPNRASKNAITTSTMCPL